MNHRTRKNKKGSKKGGFFSGIRISGIRFSKNKGAPVYDPKTGKKTYRTCYGIGSIPIYCKTKEV